MTKNILLFILGCIPVRIILVLIAIYINKEYLPYYGLLLLGPALGFLYLYFSNSRLNAIEAGGNTWWANVRIVHGLLYLTAAFYAYYQNRNAWIPLIIDVIFGLILFIQKRFLHNIS